jgi:hypothetical protein
MTVLKIEVAAVSAIAELTAATAAYESVLTSGDKAAIAAAAARLTKAERTVMAADAERFGYYGWVRIQLDSSDGLLVTVDDAAQFREWFWLLW